MQVEAKLQRAEGQGQAAGSTVTAGRGKKDAGQPQVLAELNQGSLGRTHGLLDGHVASLL